MLSDLIDAPPRDLASFLDPSVVLEAAQLGTDEASLITLIDVKPDTVYIRLEGGCQGCGMADVTLKNGIETAIRQAVPSIIAVLDVTDHAGGENPYYQPGKGGASPL